jgi:hypothetical protein
VYLIGKEVNVYKLNGGYGIIIGYNKYLTAYIVDLYEGGTVVCTINELEIM